MRDRSTNRKKDKRDSVLGCLGILGIGLAVVLGMLWDKSRPTEEYELVEAVEKGRLKAKVSGVGLSEIQVDVSSRMSNPPMIIKILPGTVFSSSKPAVQNMIAVGTPETIELKPNSQKTLRVPAACLNMHREVPTGEDSFAVEKGPHHEDLAKLLALPEFFKESNRVKQFAVWTITDNPSRDSYMGIGSPFEARLDTGPTEIEIESVFELFNDAGISISKYRVFGAKNDQP